MLNEETLYARYLSNELSSSEIKNLKDNGDWEKLELIAKTTSEFSLPAFDRSKGFEKILETRSSSGTSRTFRIGWLSSIAAISIVLFGALFLFQQQSTIIAAPIAAQVEHLFADGSQVILSANSEIEYKEKQWDKERIVKLTGEAYFEVTEGHLFRVETNQGIVRVLGTQFNVRSWGSSIVVTCYEGSVRVTRDSNVKILQAREAVTINDSGVEELVVNRSKPHWLQGESHFRDESLQQVFEELERQYNIEVISNVNDMRFTGLFVHDNLQLAMEQICKPLGLRFSISDDQKKITVNID